jgi:hypothetical protein
MRWIATLIPALVASSATALTVYDDFADRPSRGRQPPGPMHRWPSAAETAS